MIDALGARMLRAARANRHKAELVIVAGLAVCSALPYHGLFEQWRYLLGVLGLVALAVVTSAVARALRWPWWGSVAAVVALGAVYTGEVVYSGRTRAGLPKPAMLTALWHGLTGSWSTLLNAGLPADATGDIVVLPIVAAGLVALIGAELVQRRPWRAAAAVPALVAFGAGLAFAGRTRPASLAHTLVVAGLVVALIYRRANPPVGRRGRDAGGRRFRVPSGARSAGLMAVVVAVGCSLGWLFPFGADAKPFGLRDHYTKPVVVRDAVTPLASLGARSAEAPDADLFTVTFTGVPAGTMIDRIPFAVLETYDGAAWGTAARFDAVGRRIVTDSYGAPVTGTVVRQSYELTAWWSSFLPRLDHPVAAVEGARNLAADRASGMLARSEQAPAQLSYTVDSLVPSPSVGPGEVPQPAGGLRPFGEYPRGEVPDQFASYVLQVTKGKASNYDELTALAADLQANFNVAAEATPGHSLGRLTQLVFEDPGAPFPSAYRVGTAEQYAAAFALAARVLTMPSRVVVGYKVDASRVATGAPVTVKGRDLTAWPEVFVSDRGWQAFDVLPVKTATVTDPKLPTTPALKPAEIQQGLDAAKCEAASCQAVGAADLPAVAHRSPLWYLLAVPLLAVVVLAAIFVSRLLLRRRRRSAADPAVRLAGAWKEVADRARSYGLMPHRYTLTPTDLAALLRPGTPGASSRLDELAPLVDMALYAPELPDGTDADRAWTLERSLRTDLRARVGPRSRVTAAVDPRPLLRRKEPERVAMAGVELA